MKSNNSKTTNKDSFGVKQVNVGHINFIDIIDHPHVHNWVKYLYSKEIKMFNRLFCADNSVRFKKLMGENIPNLQKTFNPDWGKCWRLHANHLNWLIFTGGKEGTIFLVETSLTQEEFQQESNIGIAMIKFLEEFKNKLCNNEV